MTKHGLNYSTQDRGDKERYQKYLSGMDSVIVEKIASASAYIPHKSGYTIVDVGMASGTGTYILAVLFPNCKVIGVDINPTMVTIANETYQLQNLQYIVDDGEKLLNLETEKIIGFFNCSSIHHITSFNNYDSNKAYLAIKRQVELLHEGGVIVIRDFVKPESKQIIIEFPNNKEGDQNSSLLEDFSITARSLSPKSEKGFPISKIKKNTYKIEYTDALEFIRRKDYLNDWAVELQEEYGYFSQSEFEEVFVGLGLRTIVSNPIYNPWIIKNRYRKRFKLLTLDNTPLGDPATNYVIAGEKLVNKGLKLKIARQLPILTDSFIKINSYKNLKNNQVFDVAQRPWPVIDILPYYKGIDGNFKVLAKHGYPRPIINQLDKADVIDKKCFSGYLTETLTSMKREGSVHEFIVETLKNRARIDSESVKFIHHSLKFYTSPGGIDELVDSYLVEIVHKGENEIQNIFNTYCGFTDAGEIRSYDAIQLLKSIQVGALPDVRLEINLYHLLAKLEIDNGKWLNDTFEVKFIEKLITTLAKDLIIQHTENVFKSTKENAGFLAHKRAKFFEQNIDESTSVLEYIEPSFLSANTAILLPIYNYNNQIFIGVELRELPVPQIHEKSARLLAAPAYRLNKKVTDLSKLEQYIFKQKIGDSKIIEATKLGEKYFPSSGITPEQVYPYVISLNIPTNELYWINLDDLMNNINDLRDGHLLLCINRLAHMLKG